MIRLLILSTTSQINSNKGKKCIIIAISSLQAILIRRFTLILFDIVRHNVSSISGHADRLIEYMKTSDVVAYRAAISSPIIIEI